ncbi:peptidoglycan-binding protein [Streptomyces sp. NPDC054784]
MAKTGPQKYPGATLGAHWYQDTHGGSPMESNVGVIHTTEGPTVPGYRGGGDAPNFTALPDIKNRKLKWYQHFDFDVSSRALVNLRGGVETNTLNAVQVELVGTCDERNAKTWHGKTAGKDYLFWPDAPDWALAELAKFVRWAHDKHGIKMQSTVTWKAYKKGQVGGSYGSNGVRLSGTAWSRYYGWLGHQHVPENSHGDPGDLDFARVLAHAKDDDEDNTPAPPKPSPSKPKYEPFPGAAFFTTGRKSPIILAMRKRLIAEGCNRYKSSSNPDTWGSGDEASYEAWQRKCGFTGSDAKVPPGKTTWDRLKVPNV